MRTAQKVIPGGGIFTLDKTWQEIKNAYDAGMPVYLQYEEVTEFENSQHRETLVGCSILEGEYYVNFEYGYAANAATDYPTYGFCTRRD